ncbi:hypothetical protein GCM10020258_46730 [Sphingomonas yabuuchiae]
MTVGAQAAEAVVQTAAGGSIRAGVWTGVILAAIGVISLVVRQWGPWQIIARDTRRADMEDGPPYRGSRKQTRPPDRRA